MGDSLMTHQTLAMIFVLKSRLVIDGQICLEYCLAMGYAMRGVVIDDWRKACDYLWRGEADVLVVADARSLDPDRAPRVEVVAHHVSRPARADVPTGHRVGKHRAKGTNERSRMVKRTAAK
jgi:hypothetical protein